MPLIRAVADLPRLFLVALYLLLSACAAHGPTTSAFDGMYQGTGYSSGPGCCVTGFALTPMKIAGGHVKFGSVTGWVQQGTDFQGTVQPPRRECCYQLQMNRVG